MVRIPPATETTDVTTNRMVHELAALDFDMPRPDARVEVGRPGRELCLYSGKLGYELQEELDFLSNRAMEPNVFFTGRFLAPAMPRLDDREVNFALLRDLSDTRSRMRFLMPFSIEKPGFAVGPSIVRVWSNGFAPLGTPLVDTEDAGETLDNLYDGLTHRDLRLPPILVLPDVRLNGLFARMARAVAIGRNLPITIANPYQRAMLQSDEEATVYLRDAISSSHLKEMRRQWRLLEDLGTVVYNVARQAREVHARFEEFLALEPAAGRARSAVRW